MSTAQADYVFLDCAGSVASVLMNKMRPTGTQLSSRLATNLWPPYGIGQTIYIFSCCGLFFFLLLFFRRLISAATEWMSAILPHMVWP